MDNQNYFDFVDYIVFILMLVFCAVIGIYYAYKGQNTTAEILTGNNQLSAFPVSLSLFVTFLSAASLIGDTAEMYEFGTQYKLGGLFAQPFVIFLSCYFFVPVFYRLQGISVFEYIEKRFGSKLRTLASILYCISNTFFMGVVMSAPSVALSQVTGFNISATILVTGLICTFYTAIGGIKAVVWTDVLQAFVMILSLIVIIVRGLYSVNGITNAWHLNWITDRIEAFNMNPNPFTRTTFWTVFVSSIVSGISMYGINQAMIQRYCSLRSLKSAQFSVWVNLPYNILITFITFVIGIIIFAYYYNCDPKKSGKVENYNQLLAAFTVDIVGNYPGIAGLFIAGLFSASLSTLSSGINAMTCVVLEDIIKVYIAPQITDVKATVILKALAWGFGLIAIAIGLISDNFGNNIVQSTLTVTGLLGSPTNGIFILGLFFPQANQKGTAIGLVFAYGLNLWLGIGNMVYKPEYTGKPIVSNQCPFNQTIHNNDHIPLQYQVSYLYFVVIGTFATVIFGLLFSIILGPRDGISHDPNLFVNFVRKRVIHKQRNHRDSVSESEFTTVRDSLKPSNHY